MVAAGGGGDAVTKVGGWEESGYLLIMCLFVDGMFVCWLFVDTRFVLNVCQKTGYCLVLQILKSQLTKDRTAVTVSIG